jgi:predicted AAA+ superfamily ATPase
MKDLLITLQDEFLERLNQSQNSIYRDYSFAKIANKVKVAIGMRRAGKTYFLLQIIRSLLQHGVNIKQVLFINFEDDRLLPCDQKTLANLLEDFYSLYPENHDRVCYLFLDEIQNVADWPLVIRRFQDSKNVEIYLSGSSAKLLSKDLHTALRGRSISKEIWPFSFNEYLHAVNYLIPTPPFAKRYQDQLLQHLENYLTNGGFPEITNTDHLTRRSVLQNYVDLVLVKDIVERYEVQNIALLKYLTQSLLKNNSTLFSVHKFANDLKSQGISGSKSTVHEYLEYLEDAYLIFPVKLYSESVRKVQSNPRKIYAVDPGLVNAYTFSRNKNFGHLFENIVYLMLRRTGHKVYYYLTLQDRYEVDFLTQSPEGELQLFQVCWDIQDLETLARETRALNIAKQELNVDGMLITPEIFIQKYLNL